RAIDVTASSSWSSRSLKIGNFLNSRGSIDTSHSLQSGEEFEVGKFYYGYAFESGFDNLQLRAIAAGHVKPRR
ncbi:MAG: hypothetical protein R3338_03070, partial [Thermoanaerobaculia bacterium]|nr:hypothetical protein [Thermoanaerobaculia bacterium]